MAKISPHFTLAELTATQTGLPNTPSNDQVCNLAVLVHYVLEPLRLYMGEPIIITSGYRSAAVNKAVGGVANSQHLTGCAADIRVGTQLRGMRMFNYLRGLHYVDQCLFEHAGSAKWLHVSFSWQPRHLFNSNYNAL